MTPHDFRERWRELSNAVSAATHPGALDGSLGITRAEIVRSARICAAELETASRWLRQYADALDEERDGH